MTPNIRIAVAARKGGVGKTTTATGIAALLSHRGLRTALVDLDPQSNAAFALGVDPKAPGAVQLLMGHIVQASPAMKGLDVFPGGPELISNRIDSLDPMELRDAISRLDYEALVFDCPPGIENLERQAIVASSCALVVLDAHPFALVGAMRVLESIRVRQARGRSVPEHIAVVASRLDLRRSADRELETGLHTAFPDLPVLRIRQDAQLAAITADRQPVSTLPAECRGRVDLESITSWVMEAHGLVGQVPAFINENRP